MSHYFYVNIGGQILEKIVITLFKLISFMFETSMMY